MRHVDKSKHFALLHFENQGLNRNFKNDLSVLVVWWVQIEVRVIVFQRLHQQLVGLPTNYRNGKFVLRLR